MENEILSNLLDLSNWKNKILSVANKLRVDQCVSRESLSDELVEIARDITDVENNVFCNEETP